MRTPMVIDETGRIVFRDDDRTGYKLTVLRSDADGDFWLSIVPDWRDMAEDEREETTACYRNAIRVRSPFIGGGDYEELYRALASLWAKAKREPASPKSAVKNSAIPSAVSDEANTSKNSEFDAGGVEGAETP